MAKPTIASLQKTIDDLHQVIGAKGTANAELTERLKRKESTIEALRQELSAERANKRRTQTIAAQMLGFIRAHHTTQRPIGGTVGEYGPDGEWHERPQVQDVWPFMEIVFD